MPPDMRSSVARGVIAVGILVVACGGSTTSPTASAPIVPVPVSPNNNVVIPQNNPATGCTPPAPDQTLGSGIYIQFEWTPSAGTPAGYELYVIHTGASIPLVDTFPTSSFYIYSACDGVVADFNLNNWQWRVRAKNAQGQYTDWSDWATFQFASCRLSDGTPCHGGG
jgi:hypothetical protein